MRKILKIGLLFATITATANVVMAGTVAVEKQTHSIEGLNGVTATQTSNSISYTLGANYLLNDTITFDFTNTALSCDSLSDPINSTHANFSLAKGACTNSSVTYTVSGGHSGDTTGAVVTLGAIDYALTNLTTNDLTVTVSSNVTGTTDTTGTIAEAKSQFGSSPTVTATQKFDGIIDVLQYSLKGFVSGVLDNISLSVSNLDTTDWLNLATIDTTVVTLFGEAGKMTGLTVNQFSSNPTAQLSFNADASKLDATFTGKQITPSISFDPDTSSGPELNAQQFVADIKYNYTSAGNTTGTVALGSGIASGEWKIDTGGNTQPIRSADSLLMVTPAILPLTSSTMPTGSKNPKFGCSKFIIPYMPYSNNASQIIYATRFPTHWVAGLESGALYVTAFDDQGKVYDLGKLVDVENNDEIVIGLGVTKLSKFIADQLLREGFNGTKSAFEITVIGAHNVTLYASYNIGSADRGFVEVLCPDG